MGRWYAGGSEPFPEALLGQQNSMADAVLAGLSLDIFNRHAEKVAMATSRSLSTVCNRFSSPTRTGSASRHLPRFDMYAAHQGAQSVRTVFTAPAVRYTRNEKPATLAGLAGSASRSGKQLS